jgi:serine/threonine protein kinase
MYQLAQRKEQIASINIMILMEYAEGETLRSLIDNAKDYLDRRMIFILFDQLMRGLQQIHSKGLIHRDIKPENIFINRRTNRLQIGDFGLAKTVKHVEGHEGHESIVKSPNRKSNQSSFRAPTKHLSSRKMLFQEASQLEFTVRDLGGTPMYIAPEARIEPGMKKVAVPNA